MRKISKYICVGLMIAAVSSTQVFADPLSDQLQSQKEQLDNSKAALQQSQQKKHDLQGQIEMLDNEIENLLVKTQDNQNKIKDVQQGLADTEKEVQNAENDMKKEQELFAGRIKAMYENGGSSGYLQVVLESKNIHDFFYRIDTLKRINKLDKDIKDNLSEKKKTLSEKKQTLKAENDKLVALQTSLKQDMDKLNANKSNVETLVQQASAEENRYANEVDTAEFSVAETQRRINEIKAAAAKSGQSGTASRGGASYSDDGLVAFAAKYIGTPYVWGGTSPSGFDCSGFVQYVYANFGIDLPRTTYDQVNEGVSVSRDELQPGDLIFFGSPSSPHHVGIYVGDGAYIHSPRTGDSVKISPLYSYAVAKRVR